MLFDFLYFLYCTHTHRSIAIRAIMTVPHIFLLCALIVLWLIIERCIAPTMGSCLSGTFPCLQTCCSKASLGLNHNNVTFTELVDKGEIAGAEEFDFAALDSFKDDVAAELNEDTLKTNLATEVGARRASFKDVKELLSEEEKKEQQEEEHIVVNTAFEVVDTDDEDEDGDEEEDDLDVSDAAEQEEDESDNSDEASDPRVVGVKEFDDDNEYVSPSVSNFSTHLSDLSEMDVNNVNVL